MITLPFLAWIVGPGVVAIGTNKIVGTAAALVALLVYFSRGHFDARKSIWFATCVGIGSLAGSRVAPSIPSSWFPLFLAGTCPLILWVVWNKDLWVDKGSDVRNGRLTSDKRGGSLTSVLVGLLCGFYDGLWGPGGGTFMFLSLFFFAKLPLLPALAASKLANTASAAISLGSFALQGHVRPLEGCVMATGVIAGSFVGARHATKRASKIVRPVLVAVVALLLLKLFSEIA